MNDQATFLIGAAAQMLGVSTHTLRKWEDRHRAISPSRSPGGDRRYSSQDLDRLSKLRALVDQGHAISALASLTNEALDQLLLAATAEAPAAHSLRIAVLGERLAKDLKDARSRMPEVRIAAHAADAAGLPEDAGDAIVVELGTLGADTRTELSEIRATTGVDRIVIVYGFGAIEKAEQLADSRTAVMRRPVNHRELTRILTALIGSPGAAQPQLGLPPHRFSRDLLARMAMISPELACECPRHVGQLLIELSDFEEYSAECENTKPADAHIHNMLRKTAATSRALFEQALIELAEAEGIDLADPQADPRLGDNA